MILAAPVAFAKVERAGDQGLGGALGLRERLVAGGGAVNVLAADAPNRVPGELKAPTTTAAAAA